MKRNDNKLRTPYLMLLCMAAFLLLLLFAEDGKAADSPADYPSRPIDYVVHGGPGGGTDVFGRLIADIIQKEKILNQPVAVLNKPGAGAGVAMGYVFEKEGNPYTVLNMSSYAMISTMLLEKLPYNLKSFIPIANMAADGTILVVRSNSPFKTIDDIIAEARKRPKQLICGGVSFTASDSIMAQSIQKLKGVEWKFISFKTMPEAIINVLSGNVDFALPNPEQVIDHVRAGKLRVLLTVAPTRYPEFKDIPTTKEAGLGESVVTYRGVVGPPKMPDYAVKKLEAAFKKVSDSDRFKKFAKDSMMQSVWMSSADYGKHLERESVAMKAQLIAVGLLK